MNEPWFTKIVKALQNNKKGVDFEPTRTNEEIENPKLSNPEIFLALVLVKSNLKFKGDTK
jgi:hypothetical protein